MNKTTEEYEQMTATEQAEYDSFYWDLAYDQQAESEEYGLNA